jgi:8-oxo-dGTP diphosphatase
MSGATHDSKSTSNGQQVILAVGFIYRQINGTTKVLLARRASTKKFLPNKYELPGGHVDFGDDVVGALKREIDKELSIKVRVGDVFYSYSYVNKARGTHAIKLVYFCTIIGGEYDLRLRSEHHSEIGWFSREELEKVRSDIEAEESSGVNSHANDHKWLALIKGFSILGSP